MEFSSVAILAQELRSWRRKMEGEPQPGSDGAPEFAPPVAHAALSPVCQGKIGVAFLEPPDVLCVARLPAVGHCSVSTATQFDVQDEHVIFHQEQIFLYQH